MKSWKKRWNSSVYGKAAVILQIVLIAVLVMTTIDNWDEYSSGGLLGLFFTVLFEQWPLIPVLIVLILVLRTVDKGVRQRRSVQSFSGDEAMSSLGKSRIKIRLVSCALIAAGIVAAIAAGSIWVFVVFLIIEGLYIGFAHADYEKGFGDTITVRELQKVFRDVGYDQNKGEDEAKQELYGMPFLVSGDQATMVNSLSGALGTTRFRSADLAAYNKIDRDENGEVSVLIGKFRVYTLEYRRPFEADAVVMDKKFTGGKPGRTGLTRVTFQSGQPEFDKRFQVWAKNAGEAEKVLGSERIQAMVRIAECMRDRPFCFCMTGNLLHAAQNLPREDLLVQAPGTMSDTLEEQVEIVAKEIAGMKEIVSWLSLFGEQG